MPGPSLIDHFAALEDPRQSWKVMFPLPEVLLGNCSPPYAQAVCITASPANAARSAANAVRSCKRPVAITLAAAA